MGILEIPGNARAGFSAIFTAQSLGPCERIDEPETSCTTNAFYATVLRLMVYHKHKRVDLVGCVPYTR